MLSSGQVRAARALLRWDQAILAERSDVSVETIKRLEKMDGLLTSTRVSTVDAIRQAFEQAGIIFAAEGEVLGGGPGVRMKAGS